MIAVVTPQNLKYKKYSRRLKCIRGIERRVSRLWYTSVCGLVATEGGCLTSTQLKTLFTVINKNIRVKKRKRKVLISSMFLRVPLTKKPLGARMGRGKGTVATWVCPVKPGRMLVQIYGVRNIRRAFIALYRVAYKLPILTKIVLRCRKNLSVYAGMLH